MTLKNNLKNTISKNINLYINELSKQCHYLTSFESELVHSYFKIRETCDSSIKNNDQVTENNCNLLKGECTKKDISTIEYLKKNILGKCKSVLDSLI